MIPEAFEGRMYITGRLPGIFQRANFRDAGTVSSGNCH